MEVSVLPLAVAVHIAFRYIPAPAAVQTRRLGAKPQQEGKTMICYSIIAKRGIVTSHSSMHSPVVVEVVEDAYPKPRLGIIATLDGDTFYVQVGDRRVPVSAALVTSDAVEAADQRGLQMRISRAAVHINAKGDMELIPADPDDHNVLLLIDVSSGRYGALAFDVPNGFAVIERGLQNYKPLQGSDEVILVALNRGETVTAKRSDKKYIWFGKSSVEETLTYSLDPDLHCTRRLASQAGYERVF